MINLMAAEWLKMRKRWMVRIIILLMLLIVALIFWGTATQAKFRPDVLMPRGWVIGLEFCAAFAAFIWPILGGNWAGSEYGWGTVRTILSRRPGRIQWTLSAIAVLLLTAAIALMLGIILASAAGVIIALLTGSSAFITHGLPGDFVLILVKTFLGAWLVLAFYILLAYAAGTVFRSGAFGIGLGIGLTVAELVVYGIFLGLGGTWKKVATHFPYAYTDSLPQALAKPATVGDIFGGGGSRPGVGESVIGLLIYCGILLAITLFLVRTRDVTD